MTRSRFKDNRCLYATHHGFAGEATVLKVSKMICVTDRNMNHQVIMAGNDECPPDLWYGLDLLHEAINSVPVLNGEFDKQKRLQVESESLQIDIDVRSG